jgi:hypothetical protein
MAAAISGFISGAIAGGSVKSGLQGAFTAGVMFGAGEIIQGAANAGTAMNGAEQVLTHAVAGCITNVAGGAKCGPGALSAAFSKLLVVNGLTNASNPIEGAVKSAVAGGLGSMLGGGKFENGAVTQESGDGANGIQRFKNSVLRPFGLEDKLVIGEDMSRVIPYADSHGADYYAGPPLKASDEDQMRDQVNFIREKMKQGFTIIDIGPSPKYISYPNITSPFYEAEIMHIYTFNSIGGMPAPYQHYRIDSIAFDNWLKARSKPGGR